MCNLLCCCKSCEKFIEHQFETYNLFRDKKEDPEILFEDFKHVMILSKYDNQYINFVVDFMKHNEQTPYNEFEVIKQAIAAGYTVLEKIKKDEVALEPNA
jgi:6-pyruvoyl-tetrahydropterin synthase